MFQDREDINKKLEEYREIISSKSYNFNLINEIFSFSAKFGFLADLRDLIIIYITEFIKEKKDLIFLEYQKALSLFPEDDEIFENFINFINTINITPKEKSIYIKTYIKLLSTVGKFSKALNIINEIIQEDPDNIENLILAANAYETEGHIDKAVSFYLKAIEKTENINEKLKIREQISIIDPGNKDNIIELANLYVQKKEFDPASQILRKLLRYDPNDPEILYKIAEVDNLKGNPRGALIAIKKIKQFNNPKYRFLEGIITFNLGVKKEAEEILDSVVKELYENNYISETLEAINTLNLIDPQYSSKYKDILSSIKEIKERETKKELITQEISQIIEEKEQVIELSQKKQDIIRDSLKQEEIKEEQLSEKITSKINDTIIQKEKELENRETFSQKRRSTGVFIKKETAQEQKSSLGKNILIKENIINSKKQGFLKKEGQTTEKSTLDKPTLNKQTLEKPILEKQTLEKQTLEKQTSEKPILEKSILEKTSLQKPNLKIQENIEQEKNVNNSQQLAKSTVVIDKETILNEIDKESIKNEYDVIEVEKDKEQTIEEIDISVWERSIEKIFKNLLENISMNVKISEEQEISSNIAKLINFIKSITQNKSKLLIWLYRLYVISQLYGLVKIKEKILLIIREYLSFQDLNFLNYKSIESISTLNLLIDIEDNNSFSQYKIEENLKYIVENQMINSFIKLYYDLKEKYKENLEEIEEIFIRVLNEKENIEFLYTFMIISSKYILSNISTKNLINLLKNLDYIDIIENMSLKEKIRLIIRLLEKGEFILVERILKKIQNIIPFLLEFYKEDIKIDIDININIIDEKIENNDYKLIIYYILSLISNFNNKNIFENLYEKSNKVYWIITYFLSFKYPYLIFTHFENLKDHLKILEELNIEKDNFKKQLKEIILLTLKDINLEEYNKYIEEVISLQSDEDEKTMIILIQCWYNTQKNQSNARKILDKLKLIIEDIKNEEIINFYNFLDQKINDNG